MKKKKQNKSSFPSLFLRRKSIIIASLILLLLIGAGLILRLHSAKQAQIVKKPQGLQYAIGMKKEETIHFEKNGQPWKTYKNYLYGYEISTPEDWSIDGGGSTWGGKQNPAVSVSGPNRYDIPGSNTRGAYYYLSMWIDPQNSKDRKIQVGEEDFIKPYEPGDQALMFLHLDKQFIASTKEHRQAQEIIPTVKYLYSLKDAQSFVSSFFQTIASHAPVRMTPPPSVPFSQWKTLTDEKNGFSLKYPPSWKMPKIGGADGFLIGKNGKKRIEEASYTIEMTPLWPYSMLSVYASSSSPTDWYSNYFYNEKPTKQQIFSIDGAPAMYVESHPNDISDYHTKYLYIISHADHVMVLEFGDMKKMIDDGMPTLIDLRLAKADFETMVKSISFSAN